VLWDQRVVCSNHTAPTNFLLDNQSSDGVSSGTSVPQN
jgi:hypothetical protein